ncbi:MAG: LptF/LptG family permease, partial [Gammaproteobacteria bacterium]|nr:LptF/LptG family permease [Gammaproteobacteria bacterium]
MIIHRYLNKEVGQTWLAVSTVLLVIILSSVLVRFLREAAAGVLSGEAVFYLLGLKVLIYMELLLPVAFFLAVMLTLGRWYRDNEMGA